MGMNSSSDVCAKLRSVIYDRLTPYIKSDYVLLGLPYYNNIGDTLIWEGELEFLKSIKYKCLGVCGWDSYPAVGFDDNVTILITGGGYFGDVWRKAWQNVLNGIKNNKNNSIIFMPQTIFYENEYIRDQDSRLLADFKNLVICARDMISYNYAKKFFSNEVLLVPDMAFCIKPSYLWNLVKPQTNDILLLRRKDKELRDEKIDIVEENFNISDWPTYENTSKSEQWVYRIDRRLKYIPGERIRHFLRSQLYYRIYRPLMLRLGVEFISQYRKIYTTRLHVMILSVLLDKEVVVIDNSYGKLSSFYKTWLTDYSKISLYESR